MLFFTSSDFCHLLIAFANSLDPDLVRQNVSSDLNLNSLTLIEFLKELFEKVNFEKKVSRGQQQHEK